MKVLFGIQGTGNGHISRARVLAKYLAEWSVDVNYLISGRKKTELFDMDVFGNFEHRKGLTFSTKNGQINHWQTVKKNSIVQFVNDIHQLNVHQYDLVITDFEPITAWAAKLKKVPSLGIGHQYAFGPNTPLAGDNFFTRLIMRNFAPSNMSIGLHWFPYNANVLPPIIDTNLKRTPNTESEHVIVYLPFENTDNICKILTRCSAQKFILYAPNAVEGVVENVDIRTTSYLPFKQDLASASGVICNSGFELISECLHLGLPILTKPLNGQMEQHSNALALNQLGYATVVNAFDCQTINQWLSGKQTNKPKSLPNVARSIAQLIHSGQWQEIATLQKTLWQEYRA